MSGNQADIRGVAQEHIKRHVSYEDPWDNLARFRDLQKCLANSPGTTGIPTELEYKIIFLGLHPKGWRKKWSAVPRDVNSATENLTTITKFMKQMYEAEKSSGKKVSDGSILKRLEASTSSKGDKSGDKMTNKKAKGANNDAKLPKKDNGMYRRIFLQ